MYQLWKWKAFVHVIIITTTATIMHHPSSTATDANGVHKKTTKRSFNKNNSSSSSSSSFHLSITLPCKAFSNSSTLYNITIIFMDNGYADGGDLLLPAAASQ
jgi:hypothetical protein